MATRDDVVVKHPPIIEEQDCFVGHSYGEKPLLADDELDISDSPTQEVVDVFAMAPFTQTDKRKRQLENNFHEKTPVNEDLFGAAPFSSTNPFLTEAEKQEFTDSEFESKDLLVFDDSSEHEKNSFVEPTTPSENSVDNLIFVDDVTPVKLSLDDPHRNKRPTKHSSLKKSKTKTSKGLCNMSFEDFVDETETVPTYVVPYEVIRGSTELPENHHDSLKRRSNPFS